MSEQRFAWIDHKIWSLEQRLLKAEYQIQQLSGKPEREPAQEPAKPPGAQPGPKRPLIEDRRTVQQPAAATPPPIQPPPVLPPPRQAPAPRPDGPDTEYLIGAKLLPRVGAAMVVLAVLFFVVWGFSSGWITPVMVFWGEVVFSLAFIVLGLFKRNEREEFGQILTGIGSCALYLTFAGGHVYYGLYDDKSLVAQFMCLSFANLAYSLWFASRSFLAIGLLGGFAAALMPLGNDAFALNAILHFAILAPSAAIAARYRWENAGAWIWVASTLVLAPFLATPMVWTWKIVALYASALLCLSATAREEQTTTSIRGLWLVSVTTALFGLSLMHDYQGALHLTVFGGLLLGLATLATDRAKAALTQLGIGIPMLLAPMCFTPQESAIIYSVVAFLCSFVPRSGIVWLAVTQLAFGVTAYLIAVFDQQIGRQPEMVLIGALAIAAIALSRALVKLEGRAEMYVMSCIGLLLPLLPRFIHLTVAGRPQIITTELAITLGMVAFTWFITALAWKTQWRSANAVQWLGLSLSLLTYSYMAGQNPAGVLADATVVVAMMAGAIATAYTTYCIYDQRNQQELAVAAIAIIGGLFMRLFWIVAHMLPITASSSYLLTTSLVVLTVLTAAFAARTRWAGASMMSALWLCLGVALYLIMLDSEKVARIADAWLIVGFILAGGALSALEWTRRETLHKDTVAVGYAIFAGLFWLRLFGLMTETSHWPTTLAIAATLYAGLLSLIYVGVKRAAVLIPSWSFLVYAGLQYVITAQHVDTSTLLDFRIISGIGAVLLLLAAVSWRSAQDRTSYWATVSGFGWIVFSRWFGVGAQHLEWGVDWSGALTMGWIIYAFAILFLGLGFGVRELRYMSFAVLTTTSAKVLLVDLASSPPAVRVIVLLGLGLTMLGGGYWYVRGRVKLQG